MRHPKPILTVALLLCIATGMAQDNPGHPAFAPSYAVKFAPAGIAVGKIALGGEYQFQHKNSVTLMVGIPFRKSGTIEYDNEDSKVHGKTFSVMGGFRHYLGKKSMSGLYIEPYLKYVHFEGDGLLRGTIDTRDALFDTEASYKGFGLGAQLGVQFLIANRVVIDFYFLGPEANTSKISAMATDIADNLPWDPIDAQQAEDDIRDFVKDIPIIGNDISVDVNQAQKSVFITYSGFFPSIRFGASVGIRF